jgi:glycosyltransferase involved in cell wall biosynthesis
LARAAVEGLESKGIAVQLHRLHGVPHREVPVWLNASDVVLLTSSHEGSPNVVKEALACNRPIVSVDVGDVRERAGRIEGCHLCDSDPVQLSKKLLLVYDGPRLVDGRASIGELSDDQVAGRINDFYRGILEASR